MFIQRAVNNLSDKEIASLAIILGFREDYYQRVFDFDFRPDRIKPKYRLTYSEFLRCQKKLTELGLDRKAIRSKVVEAWGNKVGMKSPLPSQVHMWAIEIIQAKNS